MTKHEMFELAQSMINYDLGSPSWYTKEELACIISKALIGDDTPGHRD